MLRPPSAPFMIDTEPTASGNNGITESEQTKKRKINSSTERERWRAVQMTCNSLTTPNGVRRPIENLVEDWRVGRWAVGHQQRILNDFSVRFLSAWAPSIGGSAWSSTLIMSHFPGAQFQSSAPRRSSLTGVSFGFDFLLPLIAFLLAPLPRLVFLQSCIYHQKKKTTVRTEKEGNARKKKIKRRRKKKIL